MQRQGADRFIFRDPSGKMRVAEAPVECKPICNAKLILREEAEERTIAAGLFAEMRWSSVRVDDAEERIVLLREAVKNQSAHCDARA